MRQGRDLCPQAPVRRSNESLTRLLRPFACLLLISLSHFSEAQAAQTHPGSEGLIAHQAAHAFFLFSMGILIYWLRDRGLTRDAGWRCVQYSAVFFILWNLNALAVHALDGSSPIFDQINAGDWRGRVRLTGDGERPLAALLYYFLKMDHLLLLPATVFLHLGLRRLLKQAQGRPPVTQ